MREDEGTDSTKSPSPGSSCVSMKSDPSMTKNPPKRNEANMSSDPR